MTKTVVRNGNLENALKTFKQKVAKSGTLSECKERKHYTKPGVARREAKKNALKNAKKNAKKSDY